MNEKLIESQAIYTEIQQKSPNVQQESFISPTNKLIDPFVSSDFAYPLSKGQDKAEFIKNFALDLSLPNSQIMNLSYYPKDPTIMVVLINYSSNENMSINQIVSSDEPQIQETDDIEEDLMHQFRGSKTFDASNQDHQDHDQICGERTARSSAIIFLQEVSQTYKILREKQLPYLLTCESQFSDDGSLFIYRLGTFQKSYAIVDSSNLMEFVQMNPKWIIQKHKQEIVQQICISQDNSQVAFIYKQSFDIFDLSTPQSSLNQDSQNISKTQYDLKIEDQIPFEKIIGFTFREKDCKSGYVLMKPKFFGIDSSNLILYPFNDHQLVKIGLQIVKLNLMSKNVSFNVEFFPSGEQVIVSARINDLINRQDSQQSILYNIVERSQSELFYNKFIHKISKIHHFSDQTYYPYCTLNSNICDKTCEIILEEEKKKICLCYPFNGETTQILAMDSRYDLKNSSLFIRIAFLKDQEKIQTFTVKEEFFSAFDQITSQFEIQNNFNGEQQQVQIKEEAEEHEEGGENIQFREFEEYQLANFEYPYIAYIDLSKSIVVQYLDNSNDLIRIKMPSQKNWAMISEIRIANHQLVFLVEDKKEFQVYQYDLKKREYLNKGKSLLVIDKRDINQGDIIKDFWLYSVNSSAEKLFLIHNQTKIDSAFYFLTYPSKTFSVIYNINNHPDKQVIDLNVDQVAVYQEEMYYSSNSKYINYISYQKLSLHKKTLYKELDGFIMKIFNSNIEDRIWIMVEQDKQYLIKSLEFAHDANQFVLLQSLQIKDKIFRSKLLQANPGYIEEGTSTDSILFVSRNEVYSIDSLINDLKREVPISFKNCLQLDQNEQVMSQFPQIDNISLKSLYLIKNEKNNTKRGLILPTILSENKIQIPGIFDHSQQIYQKCLESEYDAIEKDAIFRINLDQKVFQIFNPKSQILKEGEFSQDVNKGGYFVAISDNLSHFLYYNSTDNMATSYSLEINYLSLDVQIKKKCKFFVQRDVKYMQQKLQQAFQLGFRDTIKSESVSSANCAFFINNVGDVLHGFFDSNLQSYDLYLYKDINNNQKEVGEDYQAVIFELFDKNYKIKGISMSDYNIIVWNDYKCLIYNIETALISELKLKLSDQDRYKFIEVQQVEKNKNKFLCRIENSFQSHMVLVWNQLTNQEEVSADTNFLSRIIFDERQHSYVLDNDCGLLSIVASEGGCKNLGFRKMFNKGFMDRANMLIENRSEEGERQLREYNKIGSRLNKGQAVKRFMSDLEVVNNTQKEEGYFSFFKGKKMNAASNSAKNLSTSSQQLYFKYLVFLRHIALPYSYFQLLIKERIEKEQKGGKNSVSQVQELMSGLQMSVFQFQIKNQTILHMIASKYNELSFCLNKFLEKDQALLDMLLSKDNYQNTPLQIAIEGGNPRCINLIMSMIAKGCTETFGKQTNQLASNFADLINQSSFKEFFDSILCKSEQYLQTTSIVPINRQQLEESGILMKNNTIVKDINFHKYYIDPYQKKEINVEVSALRADWILKTDDGANFLKELSQSKDMELYKSEAVKTLVMFLWKFYRRRIQVRLFLPFIIYSILFITQFTILPPLYETTKASIEDSSKANWFLIPSILVLPFLAYFTIYEFIQIYLQKLNYFFDPWNIMDLIQLSTNLTVTLLAIFTDEYEQLIRVIAACTIILLYLKIFYYLRIFDQTSALIRMIVQMTYDIRYFICIFWLAIIGFGNGIYIIYQSQTNKDLVTTTSLLDSIFQVYDTALGNGEASYEGMVGERIMYALYIISSLLIMIMLLNMLIAILGDTFANVKGIEEEAIVREYLQLVLDNELLINRKEYFKDLMYIVTVKIDQEKQLLGVQDQTQFEIEQLRMYIDSKFDYFSRLHQENHSQVMKVLQKLKNESKVFRTGTRISASSQSRTQKRSPNNNSMQGRSSESGRVTIQPRRQTKPKQN